MPTIRRATSFIFNMINEETGLARVPGALMIDVFIRSDYATDTVRAVIQNQPSVRDSRYWCMP